MKLKDLPQDEKEALILAGGVGVVAFVVTELFTRVAEEGLDKFDEGVGNTPLGGAIVTAVKASKNPTGYATWLAKTGPKRKKNIKKLLGGLI